jgi:hypothetical protein
MNPADKRLAVRPEDHPLQYAKFEGVIPPGQISRGSFPPDLDPGLSQQNQLRGC